MPDEMHNPLCGWTKLFHPRGPQVTLPLPPDPAAALAAVSAALDAGWLVQAPGLEEGEEKEQVGWVLRGTISNEKGETPFLLLYAANEGMTWSFLKVYVNSDQDVAAFEHASGMHLAELPDYVGNDKPQRGVNHRTDAFIVPAPKPFGVVYRKNPKHDERAAAAAAAKHEIYSVPKRLFVRWADTAPATQPGPDRDATISVAQQDEIERMMVPAGYPTSNGVRLFLEWVSRAQGSPCTSPQQIKATAFPQVMAELNARVARRAQAEAAKKAGGAA